MNVTILNAISVFLASIVGVFFKKIIKEDYTTNLQKILAVFVVVFGVNNAINSDNFVLMIISLFLGFSLGYYIKLEDKIYGFGELLSKKVSFFKGDVARGFLVGTVIMGPGAMAMVGAIQSGVSGDNSILYVKTTLDFITTMILSTTFGIGVGLAGISIFIFQGTIFLFSGMLEPLITEIVINEISAVGGILIIGIGINMLDINDNKLKIGDALPSLIFPFIYYLF